jgi:hypothetical protein
MQHSTVPLEKLTGFQPVKQFPAFYGTRRFITTFTSARHLSLSWASSIHSIHPHSTSWRSILIISSFLRLGLPSSLSLRFPHQNPVYASPLPHTRYTSCPSHSSRSYHSNNIRWGVQFTGLQSKIYEAAVASNVQVMMMIMMMIFFIASPKTRLIWVDLHVQLTADNMVRYFETSVCSAVNRHSANILNITGHLILISRFLIWECSGWQVLQPNQPEKPRTYASSIPRGSGTVVPYSFSWSHSAVSVMC